MSIGRGAPWIVVVAALAALAACGRQMQQQDERGASSSTLLVSDRLAQARVFFAHQSVGENIIDGLVSMQEGDGPRRLNVMELGGAASVPGPSFLHARLGVNGDPRSKTDAFVRALEGGLGERVDIAFQKYCFVDIEASSNVDAIFDYYRASIDRLENEFPHVTFVHVTAPVTAVESGPKALIKKLIGRTPDNYADNFARERFNERLRHEYGGRRPLFDLAALEASRDRSAPERVTLGGTTGYALLPEYTSDGGHLNEPARKRVASALLSFLSGVLDSRPHGEGIAASGL
jgi:hypothetical protein